jgi:hypothetical protein
MPIIGQRLERVFERWCGVDVDLTRQIHDVRVAFQLAGLDFDIHSFSYRASLLDRKDVACTTAYVAGANIL